MNKPSKCKCGDLMLWMRTITNKIIPVNYETRFKNEKTFDSTKGMVSHFATCKLANEFRKRGA